MAVYKPKRQGVESKYYVCEFIYQGKQFQESTGASTKTVAKEYEKRRRAELEIGQLQTFCGRIVAMPEAPPWYVIQTFPPGNNGVPRARAYSRGALSARV
jgi:hypothetical protein